MRYPVKIMSSEISTISGSAPVSVNSQRISDDQSGVGNSGRSTERRSRWQNTPGIRVSLQSLDQEAQINEYRRLRSDGRRKDQLSGVELENFNRTIEVESLNKGSVNPRTRIILDRFIQQMGGAEQSLSIGSYINTSV